MIRYFEVYGLDEETPECFGFMDTISDRIVEVDGDQFFSTREDFEACAANEPDRDRMERLRRQIRHPAFQAPAPEALKSGPSRPRTRP